MNIIFKKSQLRLVENDKIPPKTVVNSENDNDPTSLQKDISQVNQKNPEHSDLIIQTSQFTNKNIPNQNDGMVTTMPNNSDAAAQVTKLINTTSASQLPGMIRLTNGVERNGKLVEMTTFSKKELDKFLNSL